MNLGKVINFSFIDILKHQKSCENPDQIHEIQKDYKDQSKNKENKVMRSLLLLHTRDYKIAIAMNLGEVIKLFLCWHSKSSSANNVASLQTKLNFQSAIGS